MAGYNGYSMSNNAVAAYCNGEKPYSKWTKAEIIFTLAEMDKVLAGKAKALTTSELKALFLRRSSWHHTSSHYNQTDFYSVCLGADDSDIQRMIGSRAPKEPKKAIPLVKAKVRYLTWEGTRKHPKAVQHEGYALLNDKWAFLVDGTKKSRSSNGFALIETYTKAPKGTSDIFKEIERRKS